MLARLDRWWSKWLNWATWGTALAVGLVGGLIHNGPMQVAGWVLVGVVALVNLGYGVQIVRLLRQSRWRLDLDRGTAWAAAVAIVGLVTTVIAALFVHNVATGIVCASVGAVAVAANVVTYGLVKRMWQRQHDEFMRALDGRPRIGGE